MNNDTFVSKLELLPIPSEVIDQARESGVGRFSFSIPAGIVLDVGFKPGTGACLIVLVVPGKEPRSHVVQALAEDATVETHTGPGKYVGHLLDLFFFDLG